MLELRIRDIRRLVNISVLTKDIAYLMRHARIHWLFYLASILIAASIILAKGRRRQGLLAGYMFLVLSLTVLSRSTQNTAVHLVPFWSYSRWGLTRQNKANILMFIPIGALGGKYGLCLAAGFSLAIELVQLITRRGKFDVDDIIGNVLGAAIGWCAVRGMKLLITRVIPKLRSRKKE